MLIFQTAMFVLFDSNMMFSPKLEEKPTRLGYCIMYSRRETRECVYTCTPERKFIGAIKFENLQ